MSTSDWFSKESTVAIRDVESRLRAVAKDTGVPIYYNAPVDGIELLEDGKFLISANGVEDAYRAKYLIDGSGGRLDVPEELSVSRTDYPGTDRFVTSLWEHQTGPRHWAGMVEDPDGIPRNVVVSAKEDTGLQLFTRMKDDPLPDDLADFDDKMREKANIFSTRLIDPFVIDISTNISEDARRGNYLLTGEGISHVHPATTMGLNNAVTDGLDAATAVIKALENPEKAEDLLIRYSQNALDRHQTAVDYSQQFLVGVPEPAAEDVSAPSQAMGSSV